MSNTDNIVLAGGCFWCTEAVFAQVIGINTINVGYANGNIEKPTYSEVKTGQTGYAEAINLNFNTKLVSLEQLLQIFFVIHDPTQLNRQGQDIGSQYRSAIFYTNVAQIVTINKVLAQLEQQLMPSKIVTIVEPLRNFHLAEQHHQQYLQKNPDDAYCNMVAVPKIAKFSKTFANLVK